MNDKAIIIIGAGPAGLTAAYYLLKHTDYKPIILEESEFIGGISRTVKYNGNRMDIGGHRFFSKNQEVNDVWNEILPMQGASAKDDKILNREKTLSEIGPDPEVEDKVMLLRDRVSRIFYLQKFFDYPISLKFQTFKNMGLYNTVKVGIGYVWSSIFKREEKSLKDFYINRFGKPLYEMFFEDYTEKLWGINPSEIAPDWGAQRVKGLSLIKVLLSAITKPFKKDKNTTETSLIEQFLYPKYGPGQLWEEMAREIEANGGKIIKEAKVIKVKNNNGKVNSVTALINGKEVVFTGDRYISSMPIKDLILSMDKNVPKEVSYIAENLPYRDFITVGVLVNKLKIKNTTNMKTLNNIVPDCWIYIQEKNVKLGRLQIFNNWSPYMVKDVENTVWMGLEYFCEENDELWSMSDEYFIKLAIDELEKIGIIDKEDVLDSTRIKVKKAYPAYFGTYSEFDKVREYLDSFDNLYCIGRNGQHRYNNMDHSMLTAIEAVKAIKNNSTKEDIWNVNIEKDYHEEKEK